MGKEIKVRIIMRYNSTEGWADLAENAILAKGEIGLEYISGSSIPKMKIGNGVSSWNNLPYFETSLPEKFTWGNLRGTALQTSSSTTENLNLTKPGFLDAVNIITLNKNFDKIDSYYNLKSEEIQNLGERITNLSNSLASTPTDYGELQLEVVGARTINGTTYSSLSNALDALNNDLQVFKTELDDIIGRAMPSQLIMEDNGMLYLADAEGTPIGQGTLVKDNALSAEVAGIRSRAGTAGTFDTAWAATQAIDAELQGIRTRERTGDTKPLAKDVITEIDNELKLVDNEVKRLKEEAIPDGLIYNNNLLYLAVQNQPIGDPVEITGGGGGSGGTSSFTVSLSNELDLRTFSVAENTPVILKFKYTSIDSEGMGDGPGTGELFIDNIKIIGFSVPQGSYSLDITPYLQKGANNIKVKVTNSEGSYLSLIYDITVLTLSISSNFPTMGTYTQDSVDIQYTVNGEGIKTVYFTLIKQAPGSQPLSLGSQTITSNGQSHQFKMSRPNSSGSYLLKIYAEIKNGDIIVPSNTISLGMIWYNENDTSPFILMNTDQTEATEGEIIRIPYLVFHPLYPETLATFTIIQHDAKLEDGTIGDKIHSEKPSMVDQVAKNWTIQSFPSGKVTFKISAGSVYSSITIQVEKSDFDRTIIQDGLLLEFNATDRQNSDEDHDHWEYNGYVAEFNNVGWSSIDGWYIRDKEGANGEKEEQTVLRLLPGSSMSIPFYPFGKDITLTGYTIEVEIATQNVSDYDSIIVESFSGGRGFLIKSQSAKLASTGTSISAQFKEDEKVRLTFVVEQYTANRLITIYINGVSCGIQQYLTSDIFSHPNTAIRGLTIGAESCGIDIYFIRFYNTAFNSTQQLNNFIVDRPTLAERIAKDKANAIINENADELSKKITINSLKGSIPYIIMECPELPQFKGDKKRGMSFTFVDPANPERSFTAHNVQFDVQGTSSAAYPVKNYKMKLGKVSEGGGIVYTQNNQIAEGFHFKGEKESLLTKVFCLKADYASSENANNVMLVDYYNQTCPYRNEAMQKNPLVRWSVQGEPIVLFWRNTLTNEVYFQGKYNMNDDKDNENIFGFVDILDEEEYPNIECWEFLNNNTALCLFSHLTDENNSAWFEKVKDDKGNEIYAWENSYERRFPEQDDDTINKLDNLQRMINWVASTNRNRSFSNIALPEEIFYKTLDKSYNSSKQYYNEDKTEREIKLFDAVKVYDDKITVIAKTFKEAILAVNPEINLYQGWICERQNDGTWNVFYYSTITDEDGSIKEQKNIVLSKLQDLQTIGVAIGSQYKGVNVSFEYYLGNDWNSALYEKHTHDTPDYRLAKFKNEFENYFVLQPVAYYYVFTETFLLMDSRAKNMFLMTLDGNHWFPSPYDMDTALGINNEGQLVFDYNLEDTDTSSGSMIFNGNSKLYDGSKTHTGVLDSVSNIFITDEGEQIKYQGSLIFNGQESVLWNNFRDCFSDEIASMYQALRAQGGSENGTMEFSFKSLSEKMNKHQDAWPEILWNIDQEIKYLQPFYAGTNNLAMAQGDKRSQRNFWMFNTFKYRDSKYMTGESATNDIHLRIYDKGTISITPYSHIYARVEFGNAKDEQKRAFRNETVEFNTDGIAAVNDLETHIFSSDRISKIGDLSPFHIGYCDFSKAPKLQEIIVGSEEEGYLNGNLTTFTLGTSELLKLVDISNCYNLTTPIDASRCPTLKTFKAYGSSIAGVIFSTGGRLEDFYLPNTITDLTLKEQTHLKEDGVNVALNADGQYNLVTLCIENTPNVPFYNFMKLSPKLEFLRLININWSTTEEELREFYNIALKPVYDENGKIIAKQMGSIDQNGKTISGGGGIVTGKVYVPSISNEFLYELNEAFPSLTIYVNNIPKYFIRYITYDNKLLYSYIAEGNSTAIDPTTDESISAEKREEILAEIKSRPNVDQNDDGEEDVFYSFDEEIRWQDLPEKVQQSYTILPAYIIKYLVKYYDDDKTTELYRTKVAHGETAPDPSILAESILPSRNPTEKYNYQFLAWDKSLENIQAPTDFYPTFSEKLNIYKVQFFTNLPEMIAEQEVEYGSSAEDISLTQDILYYIGSNPNRPSSLHSFKSWETNTEGVVDLKITPSSYQTEPIRFNAVFIFNGNINDVSWTDIANSAALGLSTDYSIGSTKDIYVTLDGVDYTITTELVATNFDLLSKTNENYNNSSDRAVFTFLVKDIYWKKVINSGDRNYTDPETNESYSGPTAGGWFNSELREWSNSVFLSSLDNEKNPGLVNSIKEVLKKGDRGMPGVWTEFESKILISNDKIWIPSTTELGTSESQDYNLSDQQSSKYDEETQTYLPYDWFSTNETRIKTFNGIPSSYFTRTHDDNLTHRFLIITPTGEVTNLQTNLLSGYVFGFCI